MQPDSKSDGIIPSKFYQTIIQHSFDAIIVLDQKGIITYASPPAEKLSGFTVEELIGKSAFEFVHSEDRMSTIGNLAKIVTAPSIPLNFTLRYIHKSGQIKWMEVYARNLLSDPHVNGIIINYHDITKSKESETELKKFYLAVEDAMEHIIITDAYGKIVYANQAAEQTTGYSKKEMVGETPALWGKQMPQEFYDKMWNVIKNKKQRFFGELKNKRKNGEIYDAEIRISPIQVDDKIVYFVGLEKDVTKAKEVDRMKTEFISLASHQLRTPLTAIKWLSENLLSGDLGNLTSDQTKYIQNMYASNSRMIALINDLLNISRIESGKLQLTPQPTDISALLTEVMPELQIRAAKKSQALELKLQANLPLINVDSKLIQQAYSNIITNAIKYTPANGHISIDVKIQDNVLLSLIQDDGYGIPAKDHSHIFEKFHRSDNITRIETDGTGLGLYLVKAIIESSGGKIWFESFENKGTSMYFSLPLTSEEKK